MIPWWALVLCVLFVSMAIAERIAAWALSKNTGLMDDMKGKGK